MMSNMQKYINAFNIPAAILIAALAIACSALTAFAMERTAFAGQYPRHAMSVRDDYCYSTLSEVSKVTGLLGQGNFGMVNAIVNAPVYDWDQGTYDPLDVSAQGLRASAYRAYNLVGSAAGPNAGLRGSLKGRSVGYAQDFNFRVTPVPNLQWMIKYIALQLPNDVGKLAWLAGGPNPVRTVDGSRGNPYIANPFIYMQSALITKDGLPQFQAISGPLTDLGAAQQNGGNTGVPLNANMLTSIINAPNDILNQNKDLINGLNGGSITEGGLRNILNQSMAGAEGAETAIENLVGVIAGLPGIKDISSFRYGVAGLNPADNCYEDIYPNVTNQVPAYAFSVPNVAIPVTMPGWVYSIFTLLDGKGPSSSGMTMYLGGSLNGKAMLDCYGRGVTPMVTGHDTRKIREYWNPLLALDGLSSFAVNAAILAASYAADGAAAGSGEIIRSLPAFTTKFETYTSGFAFLFNLDRNTIKLQNHLENRVVDYSDLTKSKVTDINIKYAIGGLGHNDSQNGQQFNPDLKLKLKEPYVVEPEINIGDSPRRTPDGKTVNVNIGTRKYGFNKGDGSNGKYRKDTSSDGGPTYDDNAGATGRSFSEARVYKIVMAPGVIPHAIDKSKVIDQSGSVPHYDAPEVNGGVDPCAFFAQKLQDGDTRAASSPLSKNGTNANNRVSLPEGKDIQNTAFNPDGSYNKDAAYTCGEVARKDLRINGSRTGGNRTTDPLYQVDEKIPAETPAGTKICYAVYYSRYTNDLKTNGKDWWDGTQKNFNGDYSAPTDATYLTRANCIISGYKPSMQVRGGDLIVNGGVYTGLNVKDFLADDKDPKELRTYGSWAEYGVIASGAVKNIGSGGVYRTGLVPSKNDLGYLTFTNNRTEGTGLPNYGNYPGGSGDASDNKIDDGFARVSRQFTSMSSQATELRAARDASGNLQPVDINSLESGVYRLADNRVTLTSSAALPVNRSIVLLAQDGASVNIGSDIKIPTNYPSVGEISQVVVAPVGNGGYRLNINHNVQQVDAWLINPSGTINTCDTLQSSGSVENKPRALGMCNMPLTVNGPVAVKTMLLRRDGGKDQSNTAPTIQSTPGENFNLRPDAYLWAANYVDNANKKFITTNAIDLPPRY